LAQAFCARVRAWAVLGDDAGIARCAVLMGSSYPALACFVVLCLTVSLFSGAFVGAKSGEVEVVSKSDDLQQRLKLRQSLLRQLCAALRSLASKEDNEDVDATVAVRQMASSCETAIRKGGEVKDPLQTMAIIEEALDHREEWMAHLTKLGQRDSNTPTQDGQAPDDGTEFINSAAAVRDIETLKWWLNEHPLGPKQAVKLADATGLRLTHWAGSAGQLSSLKFLVGLGANPWQPTANEDGQSTLHVACISGHAPVVDYLLKDPSKPGGAVDSRDTKGMPCLHRAATAGHVEIVQALAQAGADVNLATERTGSALHGAAAVGHLEVVESLLALGADPCAKNEDGKTPRDRALVEDEEEIAFVLGSKDRSCKSMIDSKVTGPAKKADL